ncbi:MAG: sigma 54-interacting transcriptional regulator [Alicyclobacillus macrosporangiidus]|nr:sigma 54-interacting transcriptional regulator [Alicyclobacillus macrosporangiidus]
MVALYRELLAGGGVKPGGSLGHVARYTMDDILGESPRILEAKALAQKMARTDGTVLLLGESGVGKEMFAQAIHNASRRAGRPFVAVNFSALPETLMESELFGYEEGAFTGARKGGKAGLLELADGGTVFLDEIGDASPAVQVRLLRVLQEKQILRVGGTRVRSLDIRVIAATHRDLAEMVESGQFRRDLYYRLAVFPLEIPPLRERLEDVFRLFLHFLGDAGRFRFDPRLRQWLTAYSWPGNVRELQNCALYVQGVAEGKVGFAELPPTLRRALAGASGASGAGVSPDGVSAASPAAKGATDAGTAGTAGTAAARSARSRDAGARKGAAGAARSTGMDAKGEARDAGVGRDLGWLDGQPVLLEILVLLAEAGPTRGGLGRRALAERVTSERLTAEQVRSRLKVLQELGLVAPARGRQGTMITPFGLEYLQRRHGARK